MMRSVVGFILAGVYFLSVCGLVVAREFFVTRWVTWQNVDNALILLTLPWSMLIFFFAMPVLDAPGSGKLAEMVIFLAGGLINSAILYLAARLAGSIIQKMRGRTTPKV